MTTFSLERMAESLVAGGALVFSIRPPREGHDNWAVNFRVAERETAWNCGPPFNTLEEAVMDALEKIEALLANKKISHVSFGRTTVPGPTRFASIEDSQKGFHRGTGNTVTEAADAAMAAAEKAFTPKSKAVAEKSEPVKTRYFAHPESGCTFTTEDGSRPIGDGLVEEIDKDQYLKLQAKWPDSNEEQDPLADLLG